MVHEVWVWVAGMLSYIIGLGCGIWFTLDFLKMFPSFDVDEKDIL